MLVNERAVDAMQAYLRSKRYILPSGIARASLTAALPFLTGVKVKALEWSDHQHGSRCVTDRVYDISIWMEGGKPLYVDSYTTMRRFRIMNEAKAAAQADYEARFWSMAEVSGPSICKTCKGNGIIGGMYRVGDGDVDGWEERCPDCGPPPRAQALEEAAKVAEQFRNKDWIAHDMRTGVFPTQSEPGVAIAAAIRTLSSQPLSDGWLPIETCPPEHVLFFGVDRHGDKVAAEGFKAVNGTLCVGNKDLKPFTFTHWRPLPASPGASE
ncbi:hypothetical protein OIV19_05460 [Brucella sp. HL-2]|nr:hypothetical protein [Brucella sp. HL-2]MCV9907067.1 hypothetical protein [Brucella sp. HL-2]